MNPTRAAVLAVLIILSCGLRVMTGGVEWWLSSASGIERLLAAISDALLLCAMVYGSVGRPRTFTPLGARRFSSASFARHALFFGITLVVVLVAGVAVTLAYRSYLENQMQFINDR